VVKAILRDRSLFAADAAHRARRSGGLTKKFFVIPSLLPFQVPTRAEVMSTRV